MPCPDELTFDLWCAGALGPAETSAVAAHAAACATCTTQQQRWQAATTRLRAALALDESERAYLAGLDLAAAWRMRPVHAPDVHWGRLALFGVVAAFVAWTVAAQPFGLVLAGANLVGLSSILLTTAFGLVLEVGQLIVDLSTSPALGLSQPLLVLLALALLFWPRPRPAALDPKGVRS
jgi:anti-sigma factor RsiW